MAYYTKWKAEFKDILDATWYVYIQEVAGEQGEITTLECTGNPLTFEWYGRDNIYNQNIMGSKMSLNIWSAVDFSLSELFTSDNLQFKVLVYHKDVIYWSGFILAESYQEPYDAVPLNVTIVATDGLGILKDFQFIDLGYETRQKFSVVIHDILELVGIDTFTEYVNLYSGSMASGTGDSPLNQMGLDPDLFAKSNCYEALEAMLKTLNAGIRQDNNIITIYRFNELKEGEIYGRIFTSGTDTEPISKSPLQYLDRSEQPSHFWDYEGGILTMIPQAKTLIVNYNLGLKPSCLKHWEFKFDDFVEDGGVYTIPDWTASDYVVITPMGKEIPGEDLGIYLYANASTSTNQFIYQTIPNVKTRSPQFKLSFESRVLNSHTASVTGNMHYYIYVEGATTKYWWPTAWENSTTSPSPTYISLGTVEPGWSSWKTNDILINSIPIDGALSVRFQAANSASAKLNIALRNVKLVMTPIEGSDETGIGYTVSAAPIGKIIEQDAILGDGFTVARYTVNQLLNYNGIINGYDGEDIITPSTVWHTRGNAENIPLLELISAELGVQYESPRQLIDLPLREMSRDAYLISTGNIRDTLNPDKTFAVSISNYNVRDREYQLVLTEIR